MAQYYIWFSYLVTLLSSKGHNLLPTNHILWTYMNPRLQKNKRPPYWNSTSGFDLDHFDVICMLFCIRLPNFVQIGPPTADIRAFMRSYRCFKMAATGAQYYFRFVFVDVNAFRMSTSISKPNFVDKSQFMAEI